MILAPCTFAQTSDQYRACSAKANTQSEMTACAAEELSRTNGELNRIYSDVLLKAESNREAVIKIKAAENAWMIYRDAHIEATYPAKDKQAAYGSIYPMSVDLLLAKLTQQQISALKDLLKQYSGQPN